MDHQLAPTADPPPAPSTTPPDSVNIGPARSGPLPSAPRAAAATPPPGLTEPASGPSIGHVVGQTVASLALLGVAAGVFLWLGKAPAPPLEPPERAIPAVSVVPATPRAEGLTFTVDGVVRPFRDLPVAAESSGRVTVKSPSCRVGRVVSAGEVLIQVDPRDYQLEVQRLQEELEQAEVSAAELQVQIKSTGEQITLAKQAVVLNQRELRRVEGIRTPGVVTESEIDTARRDVVNARISLQTQTNQLRQQQASVPRLNSVIDRIQTQLATARLALERCVIRSPIDGVITEEHVEQDGFLQKGALVFTVRDIERLDVRCSLRADQLTLLWNTTGASQTGGYRFPETPVTVVYEVAGERYAWEGVLARFDGAGLDARTRMAPCLVHVDNPRAVRAEGRGGAGAASVGGLPPTLLVGMFVEVRVHLRPSQPLLSVPSTAMQPGNKVWVVKQGELHSRRARIADASGDAVTVFAEPGGLAAGDAVVVSPLASPAEGDPVRTLAEPEDAT